MSEPFFSKLTQQRVFRIVSAYAVGCFVLLQLADVAFEPLGIGVGVVRLMIAAMLAGLPIVGYIAFVADRTRSETPLSTRRRWLEPAFALAAIGLFASGAWYIVSSPPDNSEIVITIPRIAVAPIAAIGAPSLEAPAAIVTQDVRDALNKKPRLALVSADRSTEADYGVRGTLRRTETGVRISVELERISDGLLVWSDVLNEAFEVDQSWQFDRAEYVALQIESVIGNAGYRTFLEDFGISNNQLALNEFFAALAQSTTARVGGGNYQLAIDHLRRAIEIDPNFTDAYAHLTQLYAFRAQGEIPFDEALSQIRTLVEPLAALPPTPMVPFALAFVNLRIRPNYEEAEKYIQALESLPFPFFRAAQIQWLRCQLSYARGNPNEAVRWCATSAAEGNGSIEWFSLGVIQHYVGRYADAVESFEKSLSISDDRGDDAERGVHDNGGYQILDHLAQAQFLAGDVEGAIATLDSPRARERDRYPMKYAASLALLGRTEQAQRAIALLLEQKSLGVPTHSVKLFWAYYNLGDLENAFIWMNNTLDERDLFLIGAMKSSPRFDAIRGDPRFIAAMERVATIEASPL